MQVMILDYFRYAQLAGLKTLKTLRILEEINFSLFEKILICSLPFSEIQEKLALSVNAGYSAFHILTGF